MGKALYRKYRSRSLDEIVGQSHITTLLQRAIINDNVAHAYLLTGPRGVGKTSIARILAHEINGLEYQDESTHLDIIEIDAASNNSVEDIRDLRDKVMIAPSSAKKKIYIIDEVHMLSKSAFNALLKTLEEPPEHVVFILATTDAEKLPATIISRVQRFNFRTIGSADATSHLRSIATSENIAVSDAALELIARHGKGSFRDSISLLDQLQSLTDGEITPELIENILGLADAETVQQLIDAYEQKDIIRISQLIADSESRGTPAVIIADQLIQTIRGQITEKPHLLPLLDKLLDIARSAWPHVKLLTALASNISPSTEQSTSRAAIAPKQNTPVSKSADAGGDRSREAPTRSAAKPETRAEEEAVESKQRKSDDGSENKKQEQQSVSKDVVITKLGADEPFPWADYLAEVKVLSAGAHSLLSKCGHHFDDSALTIFAGKAFVKKKLDQALPNLNAIMTKVGVSDGSIVIVATTEPPKDSQAASILDIMGGGEEVQL